MAAEALARILSPAGGALTVQSIGLEAFRNYSRLDLRLDQAPVVLWGENGAGKTNLLEAVSLLAPGRGLRRAKVAEMDREGAGPWRIAATLSTGDGPTEIVTGRDPARDRRTVQLDGKSAGGSAALSALGGILWLTPAQDRLFLEGPSARRRFLDRLILSQDPGHAGRVALYERTLRDRAVLLQQGRADPLWLDVLETRLAANGVAVAAARRALVRAINDALAVGAVSAFPAPRLGLSGDLEDWLETAPAALVEERAAKALQEARPRDAHAGGASVGPHLSDLLCRDSANDEPAERCSTGRQKALLVRLLLTTCRLQADYGEVTPILLLDEIGAHLDARRRDALAEALLDTGAQAWLTGTERGLFSALEGKARFLHIQDARVTEDE